MIIEYQSITVRLLGMRAQGITELEEDGILERLDAIWEAMSPSDQAEIDVWVRGVAGT